MSDDNTPNNLLYHPEVMLALKVLAASSFVQAPDVANYLAPAEWHALALCYGYNLIAHKAASLESKTYFRTLRDQAENTFTYMTGKTVMDRTEDIPLAEEDMPRVKFRSSDIELMRKLVEEHDANK